MCIRDSRYTVVRSTSIGILQHDAMTWQVENGAFVRMAALVWNNENGVAHPAISVADADGAVRIVREFGYADFKGRMS